MLFNSFEFLIFFPLVVLVYYLIPHKVRYIWILITSYYFYLNWNVLYGSILLGITAVTYIAALLIDKRMSAEHGSKKGRGKAILISAIILCLAVLAVFKYSDFIVANLQKALSVIKLNIHLSNRFSLVLPVGISFYIFQSLGYVIDVYRRNVRAEKNFMLYAAFISFFPQLVAGPIERADKLLPQFSEKHIFDLSKVKANLLLMLWGFFMKVVVADRIAIFVDRIYDDYTNLNGWLLLMATVLFAFQIYCDFAGYTTIAIGAAGVMGFELMDNFKSPYCATGMRDFWARWHISLTGWFRDYVYIPLGGNRKGKIRKEINTIIVFLLSGLWHGANWSFVLWGGLNGLFIAIEDLTENVRRKVGDILKIKSEMPVFRVIRTIVTFVLVDFTWIFFRANGTKDALLIIKEMLHLENINVFYDNTIHFYIMEKHIFFMMLVSILILIVVDICHNHNIHIRSLVEKGNIVLRWIFYLGLIMAVLVFGVWGPSFDDTAFIYFQF